MQTRNRSQGKQRLTSIQEKIERFLAGSISISMFDRICTRKYSERCSGDSGGLAGGPGGRAPKLTFL